MRTLACVTVTVLLLGCTDPLREGCRYATGLDVSCKPSDGRWCNTQGEIGCAGLPVPAIALPAGSESTKADEEIRQLGKALSSSGISKTGAEVDFVEQLIIRRLLFMYPSRGTLNDCIKANRRDEAMDVILSRDASGYRYLNRGPASAVKSSQFESEYVSAKLRAAVDARLKEEVKDPVKLKATADVVLGILTKNVRSDFAAGQYRSLSLVSHQQLWEELTCKNLVRDDCSAEQALTNLGVSVAILASNDSLVDSSIGVNFETKVAAELGITPEQAARIKLAVQAELAISIEKTTQKSLSVSLTTPALVPLTWKSDTLAKVHTERCQHACRVPIDDRKLIPYQTNGELARCTFPEGRAVTVSAQGSLRLQGFDVEDDTWLAYTFGANDMRAPKFEHATSRRPIPDGPPGYSGVRGRRVLNQSVSHVRVPSSGVVSASLSNDFNHASAGVSVVDGVVVMTEE